MMTWVYIAIVAYVLGLVVWNLYTQEKALDQLTAVMVLIPLVLRLLGIK